MPSLGPPRRRSAPGARTALPAFALYGEAGAPASPLLHIESIDSRSRLHDWEIEAHVHQGLHQLLWLRHGQVDAMLDESRILASGPLWLVIPPGVAHAFRFTPGTDGHVLTVNAALLAEGDAVIGEALTTLFAQPRPLQPDPQAAELARWQALVEALHAESRAEDASGANGPVPRWLARALLWRLAEWARHEAAQAQRRGAAARPGLYTRWVALVEAHFLSHWPVTRYAERLGLSTERLNRLVRAETGHNAQALLHQRLLREATRRLVHVAVPVTQLAFELGFEDPAYFCRFVKRHTGLSPRAYREQARQAAGQTALAVAEAAGLPEAT